MRLKRISFKPTSMLVNRCGREPCFWQCGVEERSRSNEQNIRYISIKLFGCWKNHEQS